MSYQEKQALVAILSNLFGSMIYFFNRFQNIGDLNAPMDFHFWSSSILLYVLVLIIVRIAIYIVFSILNTIITRENEPGFEDEMGKLIDMKSTLNFYHVFMLGFFLSIGTLFLNWPPVSLFIGLIASMFIAGLVSEISNFYFYRKGV